MAPRPLYLYEYPVVWHKEGTSVFWFLNQSKPNEAGISNFTLRTEKGRSIYATVEPPENKKEHPTILLLDAVDWQPLTASEKLEQNIIKHAGADRDEGKPLPISREMARRTNGLGGKLNVLMVPSNWEPTKPETRK